MQPADPILNTYFAIQLLPNETAHSAIAALCRAGKEVGKLFRRVAVLDISQIANRPFVRCRSDILNPYPMLELLFSRQRGYVAALPTGQYQVHLPDGRTGNVTSLTMHQTPLLGQGRLYRGPKIVNWNLQFDLS